MKIYTIIFSLIYALIGHQSFAQNLFIQDLDFVYENLKKTTSYKTQKNNRKKVTLKYQELKNLYQDSTLNILNSYLKLYELIDELNDLHNEISGNTKNFTYTDLQEQTFLEKIRTSPEYNVFPKSTLNLDSLEKTLSGKDFDEKEGIYYYQQYFKIGIIKNKNEFYEGIVLDTKIPSWQKGETILYLLPKENNRFRLFFGNLVDKQLISFTDYFSNGSFHGIPLQKGIEPTNFYNANYPDKKFHLEKINPLTTYVKLGSFNSSPNGIKLATNFYNEIKEQLNTRNIILDLRNNGGGGDKSSKQFYQLLKQFKGNIYILVNFYTVSNAEQFTIKLNKQSNVILLGDNTKGMITYGRNYPENKITPSARFKIYFTDLKDNWKQYLPYENKGITPDIYLDTNKDWLTQTLEHIQ